MTSLGIVGAAAAEAAGSSQDSEEQGWGEWLLGLIPFVGGARKMAGADIAGQRESNRGARGALYDDILNGRGDVTHGLAQGNTLGREGRRAIEGLAETYTDFSTTAPTLAAAGGFGKPQVGATGVSAPRTFQLPTIIAVGSTLSRG